MGRAIRRKRRALLDFDSRSLSKSFLQPGVELQSV
jgi:hypothetical protein